MPLVNQYCVRNLCTFTKKTEFRKNFIRQNTPLKIPVQEELCVFQNQEYFYNYGSTKRSFWIFAYNINQKLIILMCVYIKRKTTKNMSKKKKMQKI